MQNTIGKSLYGRQKPSYFNLILNIVIGFFVVVFIAEIIFNAYYTNIYVKGRSMMPTLTGAQSYGDEISEGGDYVFVNTRKSPDYFDIVVVETTDAFGEPYDIIKRVVAFEGDIVKIDHGQLYVKYDGDEDFTKVKESYLNSNYNNPDYSYNTFEVENGYVVPKGAMFLLGDNRNESDDSRQRGAFPVKDLVGVVTKWSLRYKSTITAIYTFFEFKLGFLKISNKIYGD